jgi:hypothetical protein
VVSKNTTDTIINLERHVTTTPSRMSSAFINKLGFYKHDTFARLSSLYFLERRIYCCGVPVHIFRVLYCTYCPFIFHVPSNCSVPNELPLAVCNLQCEHALCHGHKTSPSFAYYSVREKCVQTTWIVSEKNVCIEGDWLVWDNIRQWLAGNFSWFLTQSNLQTLQKRLLFLTVVVNR